MARGGVEDDHVEVAATVGKVLPAQGEGGPVAGSHLAKVGGLATPTLPRGAA